MSSSLATHNFIDAIAMSYGAILDYAVAQSPALVFVEGTPDMLLDSDSEILLAATCCDTDIACTSNIVNDDIYYVASI